MFWGILYALFWLLLFGYGTALHALLYNRDPRSGANFFRRIFDGIVEEMQKGAYCKLLKNQILRTQDIDFSDCEEVCYFPKGSQRGSRKNWD